MNNQGNMVVITKDPNAKRVDQNTAKSLHHQDVASLESFRPNRAAQPASKGQPTNLYPSFIQSGKVDPNAKTDGANSTLPQLVQRAGNAS